MDVAKTSLADVSHELAKAKHELELAKDAPIVSDVLECDECSIFKSDLAYLQSKFATVMCELEELRSKPVLLGACKLCPTLRSELDEKNALIKSLGKTNVTPRHTDSTEGFENLSDEAEELCYSSFSRVYVSSIRS